jgi:hypothetical protein
MDTHSAASRIVQVPSHSLNGITALRSHNAQDALFNGPAPYGSQHPVPARIPGGLRALPANLCSFSISSCPEALGFGDDFCESIRESSEAGAGGIVWQTAAKHFQGVLGTEERIYNAVQASLN